MHLLAPGGRESFFFGSAHTGLGFGDCEADAVSGDARDATAAVAKLEIACRRPNAEPRSATADGCSERVAKRQVSIYNLCVATLSRASAMPAKVTALAPRFFPLSVCINAPASRMPAKKVLLVRDKTMYIISPITN